MSESLRVILTTFPGVEKAREVVRILVSEKLIACGNVLPGAISIYVFKGEFCEDEEVVTLLKTREERVGDCEIRLRELHPYEVSEFVVLPVDRVSEAYGKWVSEIF